MTSSRTAKAGTGAAALVLAFGLSSCGDEGPEVFASVLEPVEVSIVAPQYAADLPGTGAGRGVVVRRGEAQKRIVGGHGGIWLNDGRVIVRRDIAGGCFGRDDDPDSCGTRSGGVIDLDKDSETGFPGLRGGAKLASPEYFHRSTSRLTLRISEPTYDAPVELVYSFAPDLTAPVRVEEPKFAEDEGYYLRGFGANLWSVGDWDYLSFSVGNGDRMDHRGYVMRERGGAWKKVLVDEGVRDLWVARDGAALLGVQRVDKAEDCDECNRAEQIVEIDPRNGELVATYGMPGSYDKAWQVLDVDKMGDRVLVRFVHRKTNDNQGVWQYDGDWSLVDGSDEAFSWWQGPDDRLEMVPTEAVDGNAPPFAIEWVHGDDRTPVEGLLSNFAAYEDDYPTLPGTLAPPD